MTQTGDRLGIGQVAVKPEGHKTHPLLLLLDESIPPEDVPDVFSALSRILILSSDAITKSLKLSLLISFEVTDKGIEAGSSIDGLNVPFPFPLR